LKIFRLGPAQTILIGFCCYLFLPEAVKSAEQDSAFPNPPASRIEQLVSRDNGISLRAVGLSEPLEVDGNLNEAIYGRVAAVSDFIQQEPLEGEAATEKTEVWLFYDGDNIYVSARCWDSQPEKILANEMRRDNRNIRNNDNFAVILDTFLDHRNGFLFHTNPLGALFDAQVTDERNTNSDWNTIWEVQTARFAEGWTVEMMIPFKSLRYRPGSDQVWGVNFRRIVPSKNEWSYLSPIGAAFRREGLLKLSYAATVSGIEPPERSVNLEIKPYGIGGVRSDLSADEPYTNDLKVDAGVDVKYGLSRSMILDFTYNTDFAQVESDEEQVNLTRFSLFFPEKREFFLEGEGLFNFGGRETGYFARWSDTPIIFFSRRIGLEDGEVVPITVGGRVTGRAGRFTVGGLAMRADSVDEAGIPATNFGVARIRGDILNRSNIGLIVTHRSHRIDGDGSNTAYGFDGNFSFFENLNLNTYWARSQTPDREGDDSSYRGRLEWAGDRYGVQLERLVIDKNFNPEVGFVRREDMRKSAARLRFSPRVPASESIRRFNFEGSVDYFTNTEGRLETREMQFQAETDFEKGDTLQFQYTHNYEDLDEDFEISDGIFIPTGVYKFQTGELSYRFGPQRRWNGRANVNHGSFYSGTRTEAGFWGRAEITPRLSVEPRLTLNWVDLKEGRFTTQLFRARASYTFSPRMLLAALLQYNSSNSSFSSNIRFRWEYRPGSDLFVVYSDGRDSSMSGFPKLDSWSLVVKFTRLFRF
jgi:hypothetical protein